MPDADSLMGDSQLISDDEYSTEVEELVQKMQFWRRLSFAMATVLFVTGLMLTLLWIGSLNSDAQRDWLKGFGEFLVMSAVVTGPLFILIAAGFAAHAERKRQLEKRVEQVNEQKAKTQPAKRASRPKVNVGDRIKTLVQVEMGRNIRAQLLQFSVF